MVSSTGIRSTPRLAGLVKRYHTWPVLREQTNAEHTWQVMRIWWEIFGPMPEHISTAILWHDAGELGPGDIPFPFKSRDSMLKHIHSRMEAETIRGMMPDEQADIIQKAVISDLDMLRMKTCDLVEMWEFGMQDLAMGNRLAQPIIDDTLEAILTIGASLNKSDQFDTQQYMNKQRLRWQT